MQNDGAQRCKWALEYFTRSNANFEVFKADTTELLPPELLGMLQVIAETAPRDGGTNTALLVMGYLIRANEEREQLAQDFKNTTHTAVA